MMNCEKPLVFSKFLKSIWLTNVKDYYIKKRTILINIGIEATVIKSTEPCKSLAPRTSTILQDVTVQSADSVVLVEIEDERDISGCVLENGWHHLNELFPSFPKHVSLYKSPQFEVGKVSFDPFHAVGQSEGVNLNKVREHQVKVNVWFCPTNTHCRLHNKHSDPEILEVHTQIYGTGRMQKFHSEDFSSLYEDVVMSPGMTHVPFCGIHDNGEYYYGWHQYYGDTDCIWMAIEYHPL
ncbi:uncharacterized protein LOC5518840 [Nematostella vectensis]|uniref:uncharacterized protein LOC5518840 n=1 Tax=Nematostella vectensis TaxID=45351 RepID=UPI00207710D1|nr:uncharacterized protein LOC5518840 [Nematostella vectensis]